MQVLTEVAGYERAEVEAMVEAGAAFTMTAPDLRVDRPYEEWLHAFFPGEAPDTRDLD